MKKLRTLLREFVSIGAVLPGSISRQLNVCGMPGCRCKDKKNPKKHGPYFQLSYGAKGKSSSMFVKEEDAGVVGKMTDNYRKLRDLTVEIGHEMVVFCRKEGIDRATRIYDEILEREMKRSAGIKDAESARSCASSVNWKKRVSGHRAVLEKKRIEIRDLRVSRDKWREESLLLRKKLVALENRLESAEKEKFTLERKLKKKRF